MKSFVAAGIGIVISAMAVVAHQGREPGGKSRPAPPPAPERPADAAPPPKAAGPRAPILELREALDRAAEDGPREAPAAPRPAPPPGAEASELPEPSEALAKVAVEELARTEAQWDALWARVDAATQAQMKIFDLMREAETLAAMKRFTDELRKHSKELYDSYLQLARDNETLKDALRKAPAFLREAARLNEEFAKETKTQEVAESYRAVRDIWLARADLIERRGTDFAKYYDPEMVTFLAEWHRFFGRFSKFLDVYSKTVFESAEHEKFNAKMKVYLKQLDRFRDAMNRMRNSALKQAANESVRAAVLRGRIQRLDDHLRRYAVVLDGSCRPDLSQLRSMGASRPSGSEPVQGMTFPVVRLDNGDGRIRLLGTLEFRKGGGGRLEAALPAGTIRGDYVLSTTAEAAPEEADEVIVAALDTSRRRNATVLAEWSKWESERRAALAASRERDRRFAAERERAAQEREKQVERQAAMAERLKPHANLLYADYSRFSTPARDVAQMFTDARSMAVPVVGQELTYYREQDLLDGILEPVGVALVIAVDRPQERVLLRSLSGSFGEIQRRSFGVAVVSEVGKGIVTGRRRMASDAQPPSAMLARAGS